jgi:hypothetical protein
LNFESPHYLRFVRVLALATGMAATGCGTSVAPADASDAPTPDVVADAADAPDVPAPDVVADGGDCPAVMPTTGTPCAPPGLVCEYPPDPCTRSVFCRSNGSGMNVWSPNCVVGPLSPPEVTA